MSMRKVCEQSLLCCTSSGLEYTDYATHVDPVSVIMSFFVFFSAA